MSGAEGSSVLHGAKRSPREVRRRRARLLASLVAVICVTLLATILAVVFHLGKSSEQDSADREAAGQADVALLHELQRTADEHPKARALAVRDRLWAAGGEAPLPRASVIAGQMADDQIPVIVSYRWERAFSSASVYGTACRVFAVEEDTVTSTPVDCPGNTPETPHFVAEPLWSSEEGFRWPRDIEACEEENGEALC